MTKNTTAEFDRLDICTAYYVIESDYNVGGLLRERKSNIRRRESTGVQLSRIGFRPGRNICYETMGANAQAIYDLLCERYGFNKAPYVTNYEDEAEYA